MMDKIRQWLGARSSVPVMPLSQPHTAHVSRPRVNSGYITPIVTLGADPTAFRTSRSDSVAGVLYNTPNIINVYGTPPKSSAPVGVSATRQTDAPIGGNC